MCRTNVCVAQVSVQYVLDKWLCVKQVPMFRSSVCLTSVYAKDNCLCVGQVIVCRTSVYVYEQVLCVRQVFLCRTSLELIEKKSAKL